MLIWAPRLFATEEYIDRYNQGKFEFQARRYVMTAWSHQTMDGLKAG